MAALIRDGFAVVPGTPYLPENLYSPASTDQVKTLETKVDLKDTLLESEIEGIHQLPVGWEDGEVLGVVDGMPTWIPGGEASDNALVHVQASPSASWIFGHPLGRVPNITVYDTSNVEIECDITADATTVNISADAPFAGTAVLS